MAPRNVFRCTTGVRRRMIRVRSVLISTCLLSLPVSVFAQIAFERTYGDSGYDAGYDARQTADGGYIVVGNTTCFGAGSTDVYLIKTDSLGDTLWTRAYGGSSGERGRCVRQTSDGGYIVVGRTRSFGAGDWDIYLIRADTAGNTIWTRTYGGTGSDMGYGVMQTLDGGYIIVGATGSFGGDTAGVYVVRTDAAGDTLWTRTYPGYDSDCCYSVDHAWGGGYIFGGHTRSPGPYSDDVFLLRTDTLGNTVWSRIYDQANAAEWGRCVRQTADGGYIIIGEYQPPLPNAADMFVIKTDSAGDTLWTGRYGGGQSDAGYSVAQAYNGNYVFVGISESFRPEPWPQLYVVETDSWGSVINEQIYCPPSWLTYGMSVQQTLDCGYIISGYALGAPSRRTEVYLVKTPGIAQEIHDGAVIALDSPGDTVCPDSTYPVKATVRNFGNTVESFHVIAAIDGYTDMTLVSGLQPGSSVRVGFRDWQVPSADSTLYAMAVYTQVLDDHTPQNDTMQKAIFACNPVTGTEELLDRASRFDFRLWQNSPNPFHRSTVIQYSLATQCDVTLSVYDVTGSVVDELIYGRQGPGFYRAHWDPQGCADGIYFCRLTAGNLTDTRKMVLVR